MNFSEGRQGGCGRTPLNPPLAVCHAPSEHVRHEDCCVCDGCRRRSCPVKTLLKVAALKSASTSTSCDFTSSGAARESAELTPCVCVDIAYSFSRFLLDAASVNRRIWNPLLTWLTDWSQWRVPHWGRPGRGGDRPSKSWLGPHFFRRTLDILWSVDSQKN